MHPNNEMQRELGAKESPGSSKKIKTGREQRRASNAAEVENKDDEEQDDDEEIRSGAGLVVEKEHEDDMDEEDEGDDMDEEDEGDEGDDEENDVYEQEDYAAYFALGLVRGCCTKGPVERAKSFPIAMNKLQSFQEYLDRLGILMKEADSVVKSASTQRPSKRTLQRSYDFHLAANFERHCTLEGMNVGKLKISDVNAKDEVAVFKGNWEHAMTEQEGGMTLLDVMQDGRTALMVAARLDDKGDVLRALLGHKDIDVNVKDKVGVFKGGRSMDGESH